MSDEAPPLAGVVGWPIGHSRSPLLHGHWLKRHGIKGYYVPVGLRLPDFETGVRALRKIGFRGFNVTIPYKETILAMADGVTDRAALIGSANTIVIRPDGTLWADNTDGYGFLASIRSSFPEWRASYGPALVLGAGGAARSVVQALLSDGAPEVRIANRTRQRASSLRDHFGAKVVIVDWNRASDACAGAATIVNTTSLGMVGQPELAMRLDAAPHGALVTDLVYAPLETGLLRQARARGLPTVDGLGMLLHQAVPGFEKWFGIRPEVDDDLREAVLAS
jgi:shikimate dehydrogenase